MLELNKIYNEDCLVTMSKLPDKSVDLIVADPPYFNIVKEKWDNQWQTEDEYYEWCRLWIRESQRILKDNGSLYIWNWFNRICDIGSIARKEGFIIRNLITWNRGAGREKNNWCSAKEDLIYLTLTDKPTFNLSDVLISKDDPSRKMKKSSWERVQYVRKDRKNFEDDKVNPSNVWFNSHVAHNSKEKVGHPTQKPLSVCDRIIKASSNKGELVYIPFAGSGSEIVSCVNNERNYIASETNTEYIDKYIYKRLNLENV